MLRLSRIIALGIKELQIVMLDKRARAALLVAPILQLLLFGFATTLDVRNIDLGIVNRDNGMAAQRLLEAMDGSRNIRSIRYFASSADLTRAIETRKVIAGMILPPDLSRKVAQGRSGEIALLLDGRRINSAQIVAGYLAEITNRAGQELRPQTAIAMPELIAANWYNPNLEYTWFTTPGMIALITSVLVLTVSLQSIAREREMGTQDELMILPLHSGEVLIGKVVPAFIAGLFNAVLYVVLIPIIYGVPLLGSIPWLFVAVVCYSLSLTGIGLSVSSLAQNQQQAFLGGFLIMVPLILLSGYASPVDNMPGWLQVIAHIDPLYHMLIICQGTFLKNLPAALVFKHIWPMLAVAVVTLSMATWLFRSRSD